MMPKTPPRSPTSILQPHISGPGCLCAMCVGPKGAKAPPSPQSIMNDLARRVDWIAHRVPATALGRGVVNAQLDSALQHLMPLANEELGSPLYASTAIMAVNEKARKVVAAGLYSPDPRSQAAACLAIPCMIRDGDVSRGKPMYCDDLDRRFVQLLDSDSLQVHDAICRALTLLARGDCFLLPDKTASPTDSRHNLPTTFRKRLVSLGVISRLLRILSRQELTGADNRAKELDKVQAHAAEALAGFCWRWREMDGPSGAALLRQVTTNPPALTRLTHLAERIQNHNTSQNSSLLSTLNATQSKEREVDEVPRCALECLAAIASMATEGRVAVKNVGAEKAARLATAGLVNRPKSPMANQECLKHAVGLLAILQGMASEAPRMQPYQRSSSWSGSLPTQKSTGRSLRSPGAPGTENMFRTPRKSEGGSGSSSPASRNGTPPTPPQVTRRWSVPVTAFREVDEGSGSDSDGESQREKEAFESMRSRTLQTMTTKELKAALKDAGVRSDDVVEKDELIARARQYISRLKVTVRDADASLATKSWQAEASRRMSGGVVGNIF